MLISVVTATLNRASTLAECLDSVRGQRHDPVEHLVIDGGSTDGSVALLRGRAERLAHWQSEPDRGLYEAINKGLARARGEVVGVLGADDVYADDRVLEDVAAAFRRSGCGACYGDLVYVAADAPGRVVRRWVSGPYRPGLFRRGWMPPHPTFFLRREVYERLGYYNNALRIAADYELMLRVIERHGVQAEHLPRVLVRMRTGGVSNTPGNLLRKSYEDYRAWRLNGLRGGLRALLLKNVSKLPQLFRPGDAADLKGTR